MTIDVTIKGTVDDNAGLVGYDLTARVQYADFVASRGGFIDTTVKLPRGGPATGEYNRSGGTVTSQLLDDASSLSALLAVFAGLKLSEASKMGWESGRCVTVNVTPSAGPTGLEPSTVVSMLAEPRSKIDGAPTGGTVTATMAAGGDTVEPSSTPQPVDATFTYRAPNESGKGGTVALEARSRRGVGKAEIVFDTTAGYTASGTSGGVTFTGTVASLTESFTIEISFPGSESGSFAFDGSSDTGGAISITAQGSQANLTGSGSYTVADNGDGTKNIIASVEACVDVSGICNSAVHQILLTPIG